MSVPLLDHVAAIFLVAAVLGAVGLYMRDGDE